MGARRLVPGRGAVAGAAVGGRLADRLGRQRALEVVALVFLLGIAGATASPDIEVPVVSRIVLGVAVGAASVAVPLYISELASPENRGALVSRNQQSAWGALASSSSMPRQACLVSMPSAWIPRLAALRHLGLCGLVPATGRVDDLAAAHAAAVPALQPDWARRPEPRRRGAARRARLRGLPRSTVSQRSPESELGATSRPWRRHRGMRGRRQHFTGGDSRTP